MPNGTNPDGRKNNPIHLPAKPYCSADKPHIENINGLIRQYIPKGKSFDEISDDEIRQIQNQLNNRPRKKLGYKTPYEVFSLHL